MGIFMSCCKNSASDHVVITPDTDTRRRQQIEAAERRAAEQAARGIKDPERLKRQQEKDAEMERREKELVQAGGTALKWTTE